MHSTRLRRKTKKNLTKATVLDLVHQNESLVGAHQAELRDKNDTLAAQQGEILESKKTASGKEKNYRPSHPCKRGQRGEESHGDPVATNSSPL